MTFKIGDVLSVIDTYGADCYEMGELVMVVELEQDCEGDTLVHCRDKAAPMYSYRFVLAPLDKTLSTHQAAVIGAFTGVLPGHMKWVTRISWLS